MEFHERIGNANDEYKYAGEDMSCDRCNFWYRKGYSAGAGTDGCNCGYGGSRPREGRGSTEGDQDEKRE